MDFTPSPLEINREAITAIMADLVMTIGWPLIAMADFLKNFTRLSPLAAGLASQCPRSWRSRAWHRRSRCDGADDS